MPVSVPVVNGSSFNTNDNYQSYDSSFLMMDPNTTNRPIIQQSEPQPQKHAPGHYNYDDAWESSQYHHHHHPCRGPQHHQQQAQEQSQPQLQRQPPPSQPLPFRLEKAPRHRKRHTPVGPAGRWFEQQKQQSKTKSNKKKQKNKKKRQNSHSPSEPEQQLEEEQEHDDDDNKDLDDDDDDEENIHSMRSHHRRKRKRDKSTPHDHVTASSSSSSSGKGIGGGGGLCYSPAWLAMQCDMEWHTPPDHKIMEHYYHQRRRRRHRHKNNNNHPEDDTDDDDNDDATVVEDERKLIWHRYRCLRPSIPSSFVLIPEITYRLETERRWKLSQQQPQQYLVVLVERVVTHHWLLWTVWFKDETGASIRAWMDPDFVQQEQQHYLSSTSSSSNTTTTTTKKILQEGYVWQLTNCSVMLAGSGGGGTSGGDEDENPNYNTANHHYHHHSANDNDAMITTMLDRTVPERMLLVGKENIVRVWTPEQAHEMDDAKFTTWLEKRNETVAPFWDYSCFDDNNNNENRNPNMNNFSPEQEEEEQQQQRPSATTRRNDHQNNDKNQMGPVPASTAARTQPPTNTTTTQNANARIRNETDHSLVPWSVSQQPATSTTHHYHHHHHDPTLVDDGQGSHAGTTTGGGDADDTVFRSAVWLPVEEEEDPKRNHDCDRPNQTANQTNQTGKNIHRREAVQPNNNHNENNEMEIQSCTITTVGHGTWRNSNRLSDHLSIPTKTTTTTTIRSNDGQRCTESIVEEQGDSQQAQEQPTDRIQQEEEEDDDDDGLQLPTGHHIGQDSQLWNDTCLDHDSFSEDTAMVPVQPSTKPKLSTTVVHEEAEDEEEESDPSLGLGRHVVAPPPNGLWQEFVLWNENDFVWSDDENELNFEHGD